MNQEKVGKFVKELRIEKKMTQQELALKLGVSDKAISKWENGRCLMDISLLKPICEIFEVSIIELLNGEKISNDNLYVKSNEIMESTLKQKEEEIKKSKTKIIIKMCLVFVLVIFCVYFGYKGFNLYRYSTSEYVGKEIKNPYNFDKVYKVYKKTIPEEEYIIIKNIKLKNIVNGYEIDSEYYRDVESNNLLNIRYLDSNKNLVFAIEKNNEYINSILDIGGIDKFNNNFYVDIKSFLLNKDINDDIDLFNYFYENGYKYNNLFTKIDNMKFNCVYNKIFLSFDNIKTDYRYLIKGDYKGFIYKHKDVDKISVWLVKDKVDYIFTFGGDLANIENVIDIISTIELR